MSKVYVTGHRNPDMDSICAAIGYANLKNAVDKNNTYVAVRCSHLSDNIKKITKALEITPPPYMNDVYPKVGDVVLHAEHRIEDTSNISEIAFTYEATNPTVIPVYQGPKFHALLSIDDIVAWLMRQMSSKDCIEEYPCVKDILTEQEAPIFATELFEEAKNKVSMAKKRGLAVFDENGYIGYVTRRCFLKAPKYNVILVDHNEPKQSIKGIETANIMEIIDHHRIDAVKTELPIFIDAEPLGSTCTIVYQLYLRHGMRPDEETAKALLAGIISDTLLLKSPTTTYIDEMSAKALAEICRVNLEEFGLFMFSNTEGLKTRDPKTAISSDFKTYNQKGMNIGIGQCEVTSLQDLREYSDIYLRELENIRQENGLNWSVLMITDILKEHSILLCTENKLNQHLQYRNMFNQVYDMPGVMSRKKQLLPEILNVIDSFS